MFGCVLSYVPMGCVVCAYMCLLACMCMFGETLHVCDVCACLCVMCVYVYACACVHTCYAA